MDYQNIPVNGGNYDDDDTLSIEDSNGQLLEHALKSGYSDNQGQQLRFRATSLRGDGYGSGACIMASADAAVL